jgi:hypothetical protein
MFANKGAGRGQAIREFFRPTGFSQPRGFLVTRLRYGIECVHRLSPGEEFRLSFSEGDLRLLAGFAVRLCHGVGPGRWLAKASNKKGQAIA